MENSPLRGLFGVSSPRPEEQRVAPQPTKPTENICYEIPSGMIEKLKEICPRGNNKVVILYFLIHDKVLLFMLELY